MNDGVSGGWGQWWGRLGIDIDSVGVVVIYIYIYIYIDQESNYIYTPHLWRIVVWCKLSYTLQNRIDIINSSF